jgi:hypothetical protein
MDSRHFSVGWHSQIPQIATSKKLVSTGINIHAQRTWYCLAPERGFRMVVIANNVKQSSIVPEPFATDKATCPISILP